MKLMIATAFKGLDGYSPYISSLAETIKALTLAGVDVRFEKAEGDAYPDHAKNWLLRVFLTSGCGHVLIIDSDMSWTVEDIVRMLNFPEIDVVGGTYRAKNNWDQYCGSWMCHPDFTPVVDPVTGFFRGERIPGGFLRLTKRCVERMYAAYEYDSYDQNGKTVVNLFETHTNHHVFHGEDAVFCDKWRAIRGKVWIEPRLSLTHWGAKGFDGNLHEFMLAQPQPESEKPL
jgi:hypothetical protein